MSDCKWCGKKVNNKCHVTDEGRCYHKKCWSGPFTDYAVYYARTGKDPLCLTNK